MAERSDLAHRIRDLIRREGWYVSEHDLALHRTHAGHHQRSHGAWSWFATAVHGGPEEIASRSSATEVFLMLKAGQAVIEPDPYSPALVIEPTDEWLIENS